MEEWVGKHWHHFISPRAGQGFPAAAVELDAMRKRLNILFRALSGQGGASVEQSTREDILSRRNWWQRIAGTGKQVLPSWQDDDGPRLPPRLAVFPTKALNESLYCWLAVLASVPRRCGRSAIEDSVAQVRIVLEAYPSLRPRYEELARHYVALRNVALRSQLRGGKHAEQQLEDIICAAIIDPDAPLPPLPATAFDHAPVALWMSAPRYALDAQQQSEDGETDVPSEQSQGAQALAAQDRHSAERTEMPDGKGGLLSFRLESLFSWTEFLPVDRPTDDSDDDNAEQSANDMDVITVARDRKAATQKIKLDLDLPAAAYDDIRLGDGIALPEWDYRQNRMLDDHCQLQPFVPRDATPCALDARLKPLAQRLRRQFESLAPTRQWISRSRDGDELDLAAYIDFYTERSAKALDEPPVYRELRDTRRDLSSLLLADFSASTDAWVNNDSRVIDVVRDALLLFGEAMAATNDRFAMHGFASRNRDHVRFYHLKGFDDTFDDSVRGRVMAVEPCYYTRMGAAIRHATNLLVAQKSAQRLLLILTDGKPNDIDKYESRYGVEDTRMAVLEAQRQGVQPFCVTIDDKAEDYLPYLFGQRQWLLVRDVKELPRKLLQLYALLTQGASN